MSSPDLRKELHIMTKEFAVTDHPRRLNSISEEHPNSIEILECDVPLDCRCLSYALGLAQNDEYVKIQRSSKDTIGIKLFAGEEYIKWLLKRGSLEERPKSETKEGDLILYFDANEWKHAGSVKQFDRVISKWGEGLLYKHALLEAPINYGSEIRCYKPLEGEDSYQLFKQFVVEKTVTCGSDKLSWWLSQCGITSQ